MNTLTPRLIDELNPTALLELCLSAAIGRLLRPERDGQVRVGKELVDQARDHLAVDQVFRDMNPQRGAGHARTRTFELYQWVVGPAWLAAAWANRRAGYAPPPVEEQRGHAYGITWEGAVGYRKGPGGNRHVVVFSSHVLDQLDASRVLGDIIRHFSEQLLRLSGGRLRRNQAYAPRSPLERAISRRSRYRAAARRLERLGPHLRAALKRALLHVLEATRQKGRLLEARDRLAIPRAEVATEEELAGWVQLVARGQAFESQDPFSGRRSFVLNLRVFAAYGRAALPSAIPGEREGVDLVRSLAPRSPYASH